MILAHIFAFPKQHLTKIDIMRKFLLLQIAVLIFSISFSQTNDFENFKPGDTFLFTSKGAIHFNSFYNFKIDLTADNAKERWTLVDTVSSSSHEFLLRNQHGDSVQFDKGNFISDLLASRIIRLSEYNKSVLKYGKRRTEDAINGLARIGMNMDLIEYAKGSPDHKNTTSTKKNVTQQWVYIGGQRDDYLYFSNGILTAIQD